MNDQTVHAMQEEWPGGKTPCCGKPTMSFPAGTRLTTVAAEVSCDAVAGHPAARALVADYLTRAHRDAQTAKSTPSVSPVDAGEAREGDTVTTVRTGKVDRPNQVGTLGVIWDDEPGVVVTVRPWVTAITVTRPVSPPLPTEPGAVIRCRIPKAYAYGPVTAERSRVNAAWLVPGWRGSFEDDDIDLSKGFEQIYPPAPAGAGVSAPHDEGAKR